MNLKHISEITVPQTRHRKEFDERALHDLVESIKTKGLLHPIVVREDGETLVAGERRFRAVTELAQTDTPIMHNGETLKVGEIPVTQIGTCTDLELEEIEFDENMIREDLNFRERALVISRLHDLRTRQRSAKGEKQTFEDTARELIEEGKNPKAKQQQVSRSLTIAQHLDNPEVAKAKSEKEALKIIERQANEQRRAAAAQRFTQESQSTPKSPHTVLHGDTVEILPTLPDASFEIILTDPPYGMGADTFGDMTKVSHKYKDSPEEFRALMRVVIPQLYRVAAEDSHLYMFCDIDQFPWLKQMLSNEGFKVFRTPITWVTDRGMLPWPDKGPRRLTEWILYAIKGERKTNNIVGDVITLPRPTKTEYGAQKPADLYENLLSRSSTPGDRVLDCFAGTGPVIPASNRRMCKATTIEMEEEKYHFILNRLTEK